MISDAEHQALKDRWLAEGDVVEVPGMLDADTCWAIGLDPTGMDGDPRYPFTERDLTPHETWLLRVAQLRDDVRLARADWQEGFADLATATDHEVALSIRGSLNLPQYEGDERPWTWIDYGDARSAAYRRVLEATDEEVAVLRGLDASQWELTWGVINLEDCG